VSNNLKSTVKDRLSDYNFETIKDVTACLRQCLENCNSSEDIGDFINELSCQSTVIKLSEDINYPELKEIISIGKGMAQRKNTREAEIDRLNRLNVLVFILDPSIED
jgi:hypothetical protein